MELFRLHALNEWSTKKKKKSNQKPPPTTKTNQTITAEARRDILIFYFLLWVNYNCQVSLWSMVAHEYTSFFFLLYKGHLHLKNRKRLCTSSNLNSHQQSTIFSDSVTMTPATRMALKWASLFLLSSSPPPFQTCSSAVCFVLTLTCTRSLCETLSHAKVAESKTRKLYDFFSILMN